MISDPVHRLSCRERFAACVATDVSDVELATAALWLAAEEYPGLQIGGYLAELDRLAAQVRHELGDQEGAVAALCALRAVLVEQEGYRGNSDDYYDAKNSFLNEVILRRVGIPISLSIIYLEVARRAGIRMEGIGMPGHFLVRLDYPQGELLIDPFAGGEVLTTADCSRRLKLIYGDDMALSAGHLEPVSSRRILLRMLKNLRFIYIEGRDYARAVGVLERIALVVGETAELRRQRGMLFAHLQLYGNAWADLAAGLDGGDDPFPEAYGIDGILDGDVATLGRHLEWVQTLVAAPN